LLQGTIQKYNKQEKYNKTSYREQYQNTTNRNNAKIIATGTIPKY
jgi:hypothetical protein